MPSNLLTFFPFVSFLPDVLAKDWVGSGMVELKYVENNIIVLMIAASDFFHPAFDFFVCKARVVVKIFHLHLSQVDFYIADSGTGHGLDNRHDVVNNHGTFRVVSVNLELKGVFHDPAARIHGKLIYNPLRDHHGTYADFIGVLIVLWCGPVALGPIFQLFCYKARSIAKKVHSLSVKDRHANNRLACSLNCL